MRPGSGRFTSLHLAMSPGKAACLQSPNPLKTSPCLCGPVLHISVCYSRIFMWEIGDFASSGLALKQHLRPTNKQTDGTKNNKACGQTTWRSDGEPEAPIRSPPLLLPPPPLCPERISPWAPGPSASTRDADSPREEWRPDGGRGSVCQHNLRTSGRWDPLGTARDAVNARYGHIAVAAGEPGCEQTLRGIVQSVGRSSWLDQSAGAGVDVWPLLSIQRGLEGDLWWNLVFV